MVTAAEDVHFGVQLPTSIAQVLISKLLCMALGIGYAASLGCSTRCFEVGSAAGWLREGGLDLAAAFIEKPIP